MHSPVIEIVVVVFSAGDSGIFQINAWIQWESASTSAGMVPA